MPAKASNTPVVDQDSAVIAAPPIPQNGVSIATKPGVVEHISAPHLGSHVLVVKTH